MRRTLLPPRLMLFLAPVIWSTSNVTGKFSVGLLTPYQFTFYRWIVATLILTLVFLPKIKRDFAVLKSHWLWLLFWGGSAFALFNIVLYFGINLGAKLTDIAILTALIPAIVILLNAIVFREHAHILQWIGVMLTVFSSIWLVTKGHPQALFALKLTHAHLFILASVAIYSGYTVALRQAPDVHWASLMWAMCLAATVVSLPFYAWEWHQTHHLLKPDVLSATQIITAIILVLYVAVFVAIISKMFYMEGVIAVGGSRAALVMNLLPIFNTLAALLIFRDERASFGVVQITALLLVMMGIFASEYGASLRRRA